jgi:hypothetical protein
MTIVDERIEGAGSGEAEALFKEAHQRRRRRRLLIGALVLAVAIAAAVTPFALTGPSSSHRLVASAKTSPTRVGPVSESPPRVAWVDYDGALHVGTANGLSQRVVATTSADPTSPVVWLGDTVYWVQSQAPVTPGVAGPTIDPIVEGFDTTTGQMIKVGGGLQIFPSLDRSFLYVQRDYRHLVEYSPKAGWIGHVMAIPRGWFLAPSYLLNNPSPVIADGILVDSLQPAPQTALGIWNPARGRVRDIGKVWKMVGTWTGPRGRSSTIAWLPATCLQSDPNCRLAITDSSTLSTRFVSSPFGEGFDFGGEFSPNGARLAVFLRLGEHQFNGLPKYQRLSPVTQLALVNMKTGSIRVVPQTVINIGDSLAWALWFPDNNHLIAGAVESPDGLPNDNHYLVDAITGQVQPFSFFPGGGQQDGNIDINFSAAIQTGG